MSVFLTIEASQPFGRTYRLAIGATLPTLASMMAFFGRLF